MGRYLGKQFRKISGFTLLEILTVVAIMSIMTIIAIPNFISWRNNSKLQSATRELTSDLSMARIHAIKAYNPTSVGVKVLFNNDGYIIFIDQDKNNSVDTGEDILLEKKYPPGVSMSATTFPNRRTVFARTGTVSPAGSVSLRKGSGTVMKIVVNMIGRIRVETV